VARVEVKIHGKHYVVSCPDGKEAQIGRLAKYIDECTQEIDSGRGQMPETQLLVLASLMIADEMAELYNELEDMRRAGRESEATSAEIDAVAERIDALTARLKQAS